MENRLQETHPHPPPPPPTSDLQTNQETAQRKHTKGGIAQAEMWVIERQNSSLGTLKYDFFPKFRWQYFLFKNHGLWKASDIITKLTEKNETYSYKLHSI
jgi:hypothetical protein